jgi:phenylacetate-CoA ligase
MNALGVNTRQTFLKKILVVGGRWTQKMRQEIESQLGVETFDTYGPAEVMAPGVAGECASRCGLHINEDHVIAEVIDPHTLEPLANGLRGELVLTTITKEGFPLIRYRTGDLTSLDASACACGRTTMRMTSVAARTDNLIVFRNASFYPAHVGRVLESICGVRSRYRLVLDRKQNADTLELRVEIGEGMPPLDEVRALESMRTQIIEHMKMQLDVDVKISFVERLGLAAAGLALVLDNRP